MRDLHCKRARWLPLLASLVCAPVVLANDEPVARVTWVSEPPVLDGRLDDASWQGVPVIDHFIQSSPDQGEPATQRTEVQIVTDGKTLYFGVRLYDDDIAKLVLKRGKRDGNLYWDDRFNIVLDPYHSHRHGYFLQINAAGQRRDALIEGSNFEIDWDGIWDAAAQIDDDGWVLEVAVPFETLAFDLEQDVWGLNFVRGIRRNSEEARWADPSRNRTEINLCCAGTLIGMSGVSHGLGLDVVPGFAVRHKHRPDEPEVGQTKRNRTKFDPTFDAFYRFTSGLTASLSVNTDFADTEADEQRVNLERFALFFPEKRDFFLRDALVFDFGGLSSVFNRDPNGLPFFSRTIGLQEDIEVAGKVTGRHGDWNIGLLDAQVRGQAGNLFVGRISRDLLAESRVGVIVTHGDPTSTRENTLVGADALYRTGNWRGTGRVFETNLWFQNSFTEGERGAEAAWGIELRYPNDRNFWKLRYKELQGDFFPALGFVNRLNIRRYDGIYRRRTWYQGPVQKWDRSIQATFVTDRANRPESGRLTVRPVSLSSPTSDELLAEVTYRYEANQRAFAFLSGSYMPAGRYHFVEGRVALETSRNRSLQLTLSVSGGQFFNGERIGFATQVAWRPNWHVFLAAEYDQNDFSLDLLGAEPPPVVPRSGQVTSRVARLRANFYFTIDLAWMTFVQYDNQSDRLGINSRLWWAIEDGREIFLVVNQGFQDVEGEFVRRETEAVFKVGWTFRF